MELPPVRRDGLQIEEHRSFQEKFWKTERIAWIGFGVFILLALLGMTGSGGFQARAKLTFDGGFVEVPRFSRWEMSDSLNAVLPPAQGDQTLSIGSDFFRTFQVEDIDPPPLSSEGSSDAVVYHFRAAPGQPLVLTMHLRSQHPGIVKYQLSVNDAPAQTTRTIVWP